MVAPLGARDAGRVTPVGRRLFERRGFERAAAPLRIERSGDDRVLAGVAGGVGERLGVDPYLVRLFAVVSGLAGGAGVVAYLVLWALSRPPVPRPAPVPGQPVADAPADEQVRTARRAAAAACIGLGILLLLRGVGLWLGDGVMWPVILAAFGAGVVGARSAGGSVEKVFSGRVSPVRILVGLALVAAGMAALGARGGSIEDLRRAAVTAALAVAGLAVAFGPYLGRLARELGDERRERVRTEERDAMAAHLHDSVLQTLALIQRNANDPRRTVMLARRQERELRAWLYGPPDGPDGGESLHRAIERAAAEVEADHGIQVDVVVVGDCPVDDAVRALVGAVREALVNAAKHSGADTVAAYVEVEEPDEDEAGATVSAFIRDRGKGFVPAAGPGGRRGIADSIRARVHRVGGRVEVTSAPGEGTEVHVVVPIGIAHRSGSR
jgi:signal transduction histidine kinase/phage shock protein PspC (stress-responsive transcriptional regulator)